MCYSGGKLRPGCGDVDDDDARGAEQDGRKGGRVCANSMATCSVKHGAFHFAPRVQQNRQIIR